ncbi:MAG TPA: hypothetical protein VIM44_04355 [Rariglobus sp.]
MNPDLPPPEPGRILRHGHRADQITEDAIDQRARELAQIAGRSPDTITDEDRQRAHTELSGETLPETTLTDADGTTALTRDPSEPPSDTGLHVQQQNEPETQQIAERLVLEGVEEAQHDQMLAAARERRRKEQS